ncbi:MAG: nitroreductase family deazaflavin-dependent oxidoreductase [Mycobacterium sp.]
MKKTLPSSHAIADFTVKVANVAHRLVLKATCNRVLSTISTLPVVELKTTGRKSGQAHAVLLTAVVADDSRVVLIASKAGDDRHPDWYQNLVANPEVTVTVRRLARQLRARTASPEERAELWEHAISVYPGYAQYQRNTSRRIPVVICETR